MNRNQTTLIIISSIALALICASTVIADSVHGIQVLKISPQDERAVIRTADGKTQMIKTGDILEAEAFSVQSSQFRSEGQEKAKSDQQSAVSSKRESKTTDSELRVVEIAKGRIVLEERRGNDKKTVIIRLKDGKQTVELIRKTPPVKKQQQVSAVSTQLPEKSNSQIQTER
jgi:hypothetical protein